MQRQLSLGRARRGTAAAAARASSSAVARNSKSTPRPYLRIQQCRRRRPLSSSSSSSSSIVVAAAETPRSTPTAPSRPQPPPAIQDPTSALVPFLRSSPLYLASAGVASVLLNRLFFSHGGGGNGGVVVALDAASAQSRAELVAVALAAALALTGLQWLTIAPRAPDPVPLEGYEVVDWVSTEGDGGGGGGGGGGVLLTGEAAEEIRWAAGALRAAAPACVALAVFVDGTCVAKVGCFRRGDATNIIVPTFGDVCARAFEGEPQAGTYLANLALYPGRDEFLSYLPEGTRGVAVAPSGRVLMVAATNVVRGFAAVDQAWVATLAEKVDAAVGEAEEEENEEEGGRVK